MNNKMSQKRMAMGVMMALAGYYDLYKDRPDMNEKTVAMINTTLNTLIGIFEISPTDLKAEVEIVRNEATLEDVISSN